MKLPALVVKLPLQVVKATPLVVKLPFQVRSAVFMGVAGKIFIRRDRKRFC